MSVMEVSHRGKDFVACAAEAEALLRELLAIPDNYRVLFLQGGASGQFDAIPLNLTQPGDTVDFFNTGQWSKKAVAASVRQGLAVNVIADEAASNYTTIPAPGSFQVSAGAKYLHYTPNETIGGVEFNYRPDAGDVPLVADASSTILSRPMDVSGYGVIYAGAQKNMGPAGLVVVIVRDDLLGKARPSTPQIWDWAQQAKADSMLNTPPTFGIYLLGLILNWVKDAGGLTAMAARNKAKAETLYAAIDGSAIYSSPVEQAARSWMNIPFILNSTRADIDAAFLAEANKAGLTNLKGHRSVGGMRASIYNAMPPAGVQALVDFMQDFEKRN
jgi:phosphoserine aminotransferase